MEGEWRPSRYVLTVDDDVPVLRAVERDLRKRYGQSYRILSAPSGQAALDLLRRIDQRNEPVALFLVDHRMPQMTGIEFLAETLERHSDAKRVLLTAYADTDAAIRAINQIHLRSLPAETLGSARRRISTRCWTICSKTGRPRFPAVV